MGCIIECFIGIYNYRYIQLYEYTIIGIYNYMNIQLYEYIYIYI